MNSRLLTRRSIVGAAVAVGAATLVTHGRALAEGGAPIKLGSLVPLTGSGGPFGPEILKGQEMAAKEVNAAGGLWGRKVALIVEDSQSNPEASVRAATTLIDADKVPVIMGTWVSADCMAIAPLCWRNKVMLLCIGAADSITELPHHGYIARTQPSSRMYSEQFAKFAITEGAKHLYIMMPESPLSASLIKQVTDTTKAKGIRVSSIIYSPHGTSYRSEVDAMLKAKPDMLMLGPYVPDTIVLAKDLYRANYKGTVVAFATAITPQFVKAVGNQVAEGIYSIEPAPDVGSSAYARLEKLVGRKNVDIYMAEGYDEANLAVLAMAQGEQASGTTIRDNLRKIGDPHGVKVDNAVDGLKLISQGKPINYLGASGPCKFAPNGNALYTHFRINVVHHGKIATYRIT